MFFVHIPACIHIYLHIPFLKPTPWPLNSNSWALNPNSYHVYPNHSKHEVHGCDDKADPVIYQKYTYICPLTYSQMCPSIQATRPCGCSPTFLYPATLLAVSHITLSTSIFLAMIKFPPFSPYRSMPPLHVLSSHWTRSWAPSQFRPFPPPLFLFWLKSK